MNEPMLSRSDQSGNGGQRRFAVPFAHSPREAEAAAIDRRGPWPRWNALIRPARA